ncbi:MAG: galactokinase [Planctomycetes bacterium]|nr:galactokinase [Planctomycetota bacterium]
MVDPAALREAFQLRFGHPPAVVARAPGRVNLIGEHTDYNDGYVLPIALARSTFAAAAPRSDECIRIYSQQFDDERSWLRDNWSRESLPHWTSYVAGVASLLGRRTSHLSGADLMLASDVPVGGGLSSSAAMEVAVCMSLAYLAGEPLMANELIDLCRQAEHEFAGVPCGVMDQTASLLGKEGHALLLDCRKRVATAVPFDLRGHSLLVVDTGVRHALAGSEYAKRLRECREAVEYFRRLNGAVSALRDVSSESVRKHALQLDPVAAARALHVSSENERTLAAAAALSAGRLREFGSLMKQSHISLRDQYQVTCRELDDLFDLLEPASGVLGVRMTGAGFGGCVIALAVEDSCDRIVERVESGYNRSHEVRAKAMIVNAGRGAELLTGG